MVEKYLLYKIDNGMATSGGKGVIENIRICCRDSEEQEEKVRLLL